MERLQRVLYVLAIGFLLYQGYLWWFGTSPGQRQPLSAELVRVERPNEASKTCTLKGAEFEAVLNGTGLESFKLTTPKYRKANAPIELVSDSYLWRRQLRMSFRNEGVLGAGKAADESDSWQVQADLLHWELTASSPTSCTYSRKDERTEQTKTISVTGKAYELKLATTIKNLDNKAHVHALTVQTSTLRTEAETRGSMFRQSPLVTQVECVNSTGSATRLRQDSFKPTAEDPATREVKPWSDAHFARTQVNAGDWYQADGAPDLAAVSNSYFTQALLPLAGPTPYCQLQIEHVPNGEWEKAPNKAARYRARFAYPVVELKPQESKSYELLTYIGPKERTALAGVGGGNRQGLELIDLGFFTVIAKVLVGFLMTAHSYVHNWGLAIVLLTLTARTLLFPLMIPSIQMQLKMRELKPELDLLNEKYKDDAQAKGLATMELYKKHNVNLFLGCLPQLITMPVWFALYTTLQTAVELYNISFLWFPDLTDSDPLFVLPLVIGSTAFIQQKLMPMNSGDPAQQQMMLYFIPGMMTVFMLFLPAGLGIYMFTNSALMILQTQVVELYVRRRMQAKLAAAAAASA